MLERKRLLKVKEQLVREGQRVFVYEQPKTGDLFTVIDPQLQLTQLEAVQHDVAELLEHGLNPPSPAPPSAPAADMPTIPGVPEVAPDGPMSTVNPAVAEPPPETPVTPADPPQNLSPALPHPG